MDQKLSQLDHIFYTKIIKNNIPTKFLNVLPVLTRLLMTCHHMHYPKVNRIKVHNARPDCRLGNVNLLVSPSPGKALI